MANAKDVSIFFKNEYDCEIKVTELNYLLPDGSWTTEHMFGLDGHQKLEPHQCLGGKRTLEKVGGELTQFRVTFEKHLGGTKWSERYIMYYGQSVVKSYDKITLGIDPDHAQPWTIFDRV